jgi:NAD(P)-dependent dehydrogenase (short-subunit alcohol dehydrogenase family)
VSARDKTAIVTGGSAGIGASVCKALLDSGYEVISLARRAGELSSPKFTHITIDLTDQTATADVARDLARSRPASTIIHNAGAVREKALEDASLEDLTALFNLHMAAGFSLVQANLAHMKAGQFGRIVLVSTRAVLGLARRTAYSSTKAGMIGMSRTWALELAPFGITVNTVAPGPIADTEVFHNIIPRDSPKIPTIEQSIPVKRLGKPSDVTRAVMFFAAPENEFVTGQTLFVCGGTSVGSIVF